MVQEQSQASISQILDTFKQEQIIVVIRANTADGALWGAEELIHCGFKVIEITFTVPQAEMVIQTLTDRYPEITVGAGTVMNPRNAMKALGAGAEFLVSPVLDEAMVQWGSQQQVLTLPGVMTPSEIHRGFSIGAPAVKLFPAKQAGGAEYLKSLIEPLGSLPIVPTGGIGLDDFTDYLNNGALAVGIGGYLAPVTVLSERNRSELQKRGKIFQEKLRQYREAHG